MTAHIDEEDKYHGPNRRAEVHLSDDQIDAIAEKAAAKAVEKMTSGIYKSIGKSVVEKAFYITGALALAVWLWLKNKGIV